MNFKRAGVVLAAVDRDLDKPGRRLSLPEEELPLAIPPALTVTASCYSRILEIAHS